MSKLTHLTPRHIQCLNLAKRGMQNAAIAEKLGVKKRTVDFHMMVINKRLGTSNRFEAIRKAVNKGLIEW